MSTTEFLIDISLVDWPHVRGLAELTAMLLVPRLTWVIVIACRLCTRRERMPESSSLPYRAHSGERKPFLPIIQPWKTNSCQRLGRYLKHREPIIAVVMHSPRECRDVWWRHVPDAGLVNKRVIVSRKGLASPATPSVAASFLVSTAVYDTPSESMLFNGNIVGKCP